MTSTNIQLTFYFQVNFSVGELIRQKKYSSVQSCQTRIRTEYFYQMTSENQQKNVVKYKIILIGDSGVGKTTLFWRYIQNETLPDQPMTTIDFRYKHIDLHDKRARLCIWDTAGQEKFRSIVATYFKSCQGVVLIFDLSSAESWHNVKNIWYQLAFKRASHATFLLLGNKKDLPSAISITDIHSWCTQKGIFFIQTCALTGENIQQSFFTLAALIDSHQQNSVTSSFSSAHASNLSFCETTQQGTIFRKQASMAIQQAKEMRSTSFSLKKIKSKTKKQCCR